MNADALGGALDGRDDPVRPTVGGAGQENFIPWSQIEPLMVPGMTGEELHRAVCSRLGLSPETYSLYMPNALGLPLAEGLKQGVMVFHNDRPPAIACRNANRDSVV